MQKKKKGFFERLGGSVKLDDDFDVFDEDFDEDVKREREPQPQKSMRDDKRPVLPRTAPPPPREEPMPTSGELGIDMFETPGEIIIRTFVAGVRPDSLDIAISRDMVTISGARESHSTATGENFFHRELYWGAFTRRVVLPVEIDVEAATAGAKDGLLTLTLPKMDKARQTKLKVKAG